MNQTSRRRCESERSTIRGQNHTDDGVTRPVLASSMFPLPGADLTSGFVRLNSDGAWSQVCEAHLNTDVTVAEGMLDAALAMRPVRYSMLDRAPGRASSASSRQRSTPPRLDAGTPKSMSRTYPHRISSFALVIT